MCLFNVQLSQEEHKLKLKLIKIAARNQKDEAKIARKGKPPGSVERRMRHIKVMESRIGKKKFRSLQYMFLQYSPCLFLF